MGALLLSGCVGESGDEGAGGKVTVETGSLSKQDFVERADRLCRKARSEFQKDFEAFAASSPQEAANARDRIVRTMLIPPYERLVHDLALIGAPSGDEDEVSNFLNRLQGRLDALDAQPQQAFGSLTPFPGLARVASAYGMDGCADSLT